MKKVIALLLVLSLFAVSAGCGKSYEEMVEEAAQLTPEEQELRDKTNKMHEEYLQWKERKNNALDNVDSNFDYYGELWDELEEIADDSGYIKASDMERAKEIVDELNDALDLDITITSGYIEDYDDLCDNMN